MSERDEESIAYLMETGIFPRLLEILKQMVDIDPLPSDPLMHILHLLGCPLIPQAQMKALERKVSRAHDELRHLRRLIIDLDALDQLYDGENEEEYVGNVEEAVSSSSEDSMVESIESTQREHVYTSMSSLKD
ncbi:uncharacterized protein LOC6616977 [Drosophila sechellia]|uniref:GM10210 n=1 Tax=Drosophila sechellia TaxID=7238 RepID=B4ICE7_DROSE|nr:uncharacterized protein LOC6616977 [Drosophila sechellia]EDW45043.1 GM10210 [Drosophila sechellia]